MNTAGTLARVAVRAVLCANSRLHIAICVPRYEYQQPYQAEEVNNELGQSARHCVNKVAWQPPGIRVS